MEVSLEARSMYLTQYLKRLIESEYQGNIDFFGMTGSCAAGKEDKYSDFDVVLIAGDNAKKTIGECFIMNWGDIKIGYDFYTMDWNRVENMVGTTWASHILDVVPLWFADDGVKERWMDLVRRQQESCQASLSVKQIETAGESLKSAKQYLADIFITEEDKWAKNQLSCMLMNLTDVICVLNNTYYHYGIKDRIAEVEQMEHPESFVQFWHEAMAAESLEEIRKLAVKLCRMVETFWKTKEETVLRSELEEKRRKPELICGWYEELVSNYKNKVNRLIENQDAELACLVSCCAQNYLQELAEHTGIPVPVLYKDLDVKNLSALQDGFTRVEEKILEEYTARGLKPDVREYRKCL